MFALCFIKKLDLAKLTCKDEKKFCLPCLLLCLFGRVGGREGEGAERLEKNNLSMFTRKSSINYIMIHEY
jgi:hypothetical protein